MRRQGLFRLHHDEEGVTAIIVALCLISLVGMLVLVVDVGGLVYRRREMVSGSDAAALAAAKTCAVPAVTDPTDPRFSRQPPFNSFSEFRDPGKININTIAGEETM